MSDAQDDFFKKGSNCEANAIRLHDRWAEESDSVRRVTACNQHVKFAERAYQKAIEYYRKGMAAGDARSALALGNLYRYVSLTGLLCLPMH